MMHYQDLVLKVKSGERPRRLDIRMVVNAILYMVVGGIQWRMLPKEYPNWHSVYYYFQVWRDDGTLLKSLDPCLTVWSTRSVMLLDRTKSS